MSSRCERETGRDTLAEGGVEWCWGPRCERIWCPEDEDEEKVWLSASWNAEVVGEDSEARESCE